MPNTGASGSLVDLDTQEVFRFEWLPNEIKQVIRAKRSKQQIPGLSHRRSQFINTDSQGIQFSLVFEALQHGGPEKIDEARQWLFSLLYPKRSNYIHGAGQPKVLLNIPGNLNVTGHVEEVEITQELLFDDGRLRRFTAAIVFVEELQGRLTSQDVRRSRLSRGIEG